VAAKRVTRVRAELRAVCWLKVLVLLHVHERGFKLARDPLIEIRGGVQKFQAGVVTLELADVVATELGFQESA